jgi:aspartate 4-decarboxylase
MARTRKHKKYKRKTLHGLRYKIKNVPKKLFRRYKEISPFELKNKLMKMAKGTDPDQMLNAGRGNPNFFNDFGRRFLYKLSNMCIDLAHKKKNMDDLVIYPTLDDYDYEKVFKSRSNKWPTRYRDFLHDYMKYLKKMAIQDKIPPNVIFHDVVMSALGCFYPSPPRIQPHLRLIVEQFLYNLVMGSYTTSYKPEDFSYFATEGAASGIMYVFNTLKENYLLLPGDSIALITPIFSPYLEMPLLGDYKLNIVELKGDPDKQYSLDHKEMDKLKDKKIKALFMVNPANPGGYSLSKDNIEYIGKIVNTERKDLIVLSDNVYAPFVSEYNSFMQTCPQNTIEVFSLSKFFGTTGWRLGLCMIAKENRLNTLLHNLPKKYKDNLYERYKIAAMHPSKLSFMQRLVFDSRQVAEAHVGGLSTPQQTLIGIYLYYFMHDTSGHYKKQIQSILENRMNLLYKDLNTKITMLSTSTNYYNLINVPEVTENLYGRPAREYLEKNYEYLEFLFHLAKLYHVVLLPGAGFGSTPWKVRISLANLADQDYTKIGTALQMCIKDFVRPALQN